MRGTHPERALEQTIERGEAIRRGARVLVACSGGADSVALVLGDNLFYGHDFSKPLLKAAAQPSGATVFAYAVRDPERYGVVEFDDDGKVISIEEKPLKPKSTYAVPGIYFYDANAPALARELKPSDRGELEITALNNAYLERGKLRVEVLSRATTWLDTGTHESLYEAGGLIRTLQHRTGLRIGDVEQIGVDQGWIEQP